MATLVGRTDSKVSKAARMMGKRSARKRLEQRGEEGFRRRMSEWGKLGGKPKGSGKQWKKGGKA